MGDFNFNVNYFLTKLENCFYFYYYVNLFLFNINYEYLLIFFCLFCALLWFLTTYTLINKLLFFFLSLVCLSAILWLLSLEVWGFILVLTELTLLFFFFILSTHVHLKHLKLYARSPYFILAMLFLMISFYSLDNTFNLLNSPIDYYKAMYLVITADYFFIYYFLAVYWNIILYTAIILGLFSLFFILIFYQSRNLYSMSKKKTKSIYFIRKQSTIHQAYYNTYLRWFQ